MVEVRTIIHDLNNALTTVLGHAEWLLSPDSKGVDVRRELAAIRASAEHAAKMARDLREWVRTQQAADGAPLDESLAALAALAPRAPLRVVPPPALPNGARHILLVDDQEEVRNSIRDMLTALGHIVETAGLGQDGLRRLSERPFDILLTDFSMPDLDGVTLASEARRLRPGMPVVLLTGWGTAHHAAHEAVQMVIEKPITLTSLREAVDLLAAA